MSHGMFFAVKVTSFFWTPCPTISHGYQQFENKAATHVVLAPYLAINSYKDSVPNRASSAQSLRTAATLDGFPEALKISGLEAVGLIVIMLPKVRVLSI